jgi:hypothetical protein
MNEPSIPTNATLTARSIKTSATRVALDDDGDDKGKQRLSFKAPASRYLNRANFIVSTTIASLC